MDWRRVDWRRKEGMWSALNWSQMKWSREEGYKRHAELSSQQILYAIITGEHTSQYEFKLKKIQNCK